jgi:N-acetylmuramoyl-L-alanine amidase
MPWRRGALIFLLLCACPPASAEVTVDNLRMWQAPDHTRLVFDLSGPLEHRLFSLKNPERIVVDMQGGALRGVLPTLEFDGRFLKGIRSGRPEANTLRIVLDLQRPVRPRTFVLTPNEKYGHRLVIDLYDTATSEAPVPPRPAPRERRQLVVAVDAGHGGEDFGAIGPRRVAEKDVVLAIARELHKLLKADPLMKPVLIRDGDYYISLQGRVAKAKDRQADLFVSIHADSFRKREVRGASVYALSQRGASSTQAKILADKENAADLFGGVSISDKDDLLAKVLLDLSMTQTISDSLEFGDDVLKSLRRVGPLHIPRVEQAGFAVLKSPDIPSILVETAFISNPGDERLLRSRAHQRKIAQAVYEGIRHYVARGKILRTVSYKSREYVVRPGDTLSEIAQRHAVSVNELRTANDIRGSLLKVGQVLTIPNAGIGG